MVSQNVPDTLQKMHVKRMVPQIATLQMNLEWLAVRQNLFLVVVLEVLLGVVVQHVIIQDTVVMEFSDHLLEKSVISEMPIMMPQVHFVRDNVRFRLPQILEKIPLLIVGCVYLHFRDFVYDTHGLMVTH